MIETLQPVAGAPNAAPKKVTLMVSELYRSIQGESTYNGWPCAFVRLTGCPLRCRWCDSAFAFAGGERLDLDEIVQRVKGMGTPLAEVTGGEPLAQAGCLELLRALCDAGLKVLIETSGALDIAPVDARVVKIVDVKCPGSGEDQRMRWENLEHLALGDELKFVLADRADYEWARQVIASRHLASGLAHINFSPVHGALDPAELTRWILEDQVPARLNLQIHKYVWPGQTQGV